MREVRDLQSRCGKEVVGDGGEALLEGGGHGGGREKGEGEVESRVCFSSILFLVGG